MTKGHINDRLVRRARSAEQKELRRDAIIDAGTALCAGRGPLGFTMSEVATAAGIAKGTTFLYFPTREALLLAVLERLLERWLAEASRLVASKKAWLPGPLATALARSLARHRDFARLLTLLESILERNIDFDTALAFKAKLAASMHAAAATLEQHAPFVAPGAGFRLLLQIRALVSGIHAMADRPEVVERVIEHRRDLRVFAIDFKTELERALESLFLGYRARDAARRRTAKN